jgi:hypothetical protein
MTGSKRNQKFAERRRTQNFRSGAGSQSASEYEPGPVKRNTTANNNCVSSKERVETFARRRRQQSICTLPQCMANLWRFHRPIGSSVSGVTSLGWFLPRAGLPSPSVIARQHPLVTSANNNYERRNERGPAYHGMD